MKIVILIAVVVLAGTAIYTTKQATKPHCVVYPKTSNEFELQAPDNGHCPDRH
jgi:hypothetical protein